MNKNKSEKLYDEALKLFPGGVNSPVRAFKSVYGTPLFMQRSKGSHIWDVDGNEYIDFCCSWGPLILGHNSLSVKNAIIEAVEKGTSFGTPTPYGNELASLIVENNRFVEKIRFVNSGTEAVMSAVRLARGYTGKNKIIKFEGCYHGHVDHLLVKAGSGLATFGVSSSAGVPEAFAAETIVLPLNDIAALNLAFEQHKNDIAAIIIEPIPANNGLLLQSESYLKFLRDICSQNDALLIFDEVISGFRVGFEGAAGYYDIQPDIITFRKIIGGGMPVGAFGGRKEIMKRIAPEGDVYQAGTLSANPIAMTAGLAALEQLIAPNFYDSLEAKTNRIVSRLKTFIDDHQLNARIQNIGSIFWILFSKDRILTSSQIDSKSMDRFKILHADLLENNIYLGPSGYEVGFVSAAHTDEILAIAAQKIEAALLKACL